MHFVHIRYTWIYMLSGLRHTIILRGKKNNVNSEERNLMIEKTNIVPMYFAVVSLFYLPKSPALIMH